MYIQRKLESQLLKYLNAPEILAVVGPRQCGKTTLLAHVVKNLDGASSVTFEDRRILNMFDNATDDFVDLYMKNWRYLFIDEFQYSKEGGKKLKYLFDTQKTKIFISGSSGIELTVQALKFLVGRIFILNLFPLDFEEFLNYKAENYLPILKKNHETFCQGNIIHPTDTHQILSRYYEEYAIFGGYPRVVLSESQEEKKEVLKNIYNTYFLREVRDILGLIDDYKLDKLIKALALQVGNMIGYGELSQISEFSYPTLKKYANFLEKTFICQFIKPFFKNKRIEIVKNPKVYFFDTGLRNIIINDFRKINDRHDAGALLENTLFQQCVKNGLSPQYWRSKQKEEIDLILQMEGRENIAIEVKKTLTQKSLKAPNQFRNMYPEIKMICAYFDIKSAAKNHTSEYTSYPIYSIY